MKFEITIEGSLLHINKHAINLKHEISNYVVYERIVILLLEVPLKVKDNQNVLAFDSNGNQIWEIENHFPNDDDCPYNMLKLDENNNLHLYNWCGFVVKLNPSNGKLLEIISTK